ncbi:hypothetical protein [Chamaesiphon minutus]|nr:hypothetical protein [Chamaesiphon minutus]
MGTSHTVEQRTNYRNYREAGNDGKFANGTYLDDRGEIAWYG